MLHFSHLDEWINISGFDITFKDDEYILKYKLPEPFQANIDDNYKLILAPTVSGPTVSIVQKEISLEQKWYVVIESQTEKSFEEYSKIMYDTQNLLSLGINEPVYPLSIEGFIEGKEYPPVGVFYRLAYGYEVSRTVMPLGMLFAFKHLSSNFELYIRNWFYKARLLRGVYDLYFGTLRAPKMYLRNQFLNLVQAIESYHRQTIRNVELEKDIHEKRINSILESVPNEYKSWLNQKLAYSNEPSLRQRMGDVTSSNSEILRRFIDNCDEFIQKIIVTRNYFTHNDKELEKEAVREEELYPYILKLRTLLEILLLQELGFTSRDIERSLDRRDLRVIELDS